MGTPRIYVACLASYNSGILWGEWIDATQDPSDIYDDISTMMAESPIENSEEWAVQDYENFGDCQIDEYESIEKNCRICHIH